MPQFDVYKNPNRATAREAPYLLDVQSDLLEPLSTRVVVPLIATKRMKRTLSNLNPLFEIEGHQVILSTAELAAIPSSHLGPAIANLAQARSAIVSALDFLFTGI
ncbi:MAG: plasmid maintenance protein CcdB [Betaproteobacteria bacterium RBG_16_58_11]|nr:MAG: plasmid maintenance protein CcdB [Betaproteobacteria bacterium RBG_16_58_11]OFZ97403.1 MAG: plasmid maintenance protein CcdB [Betaproteobacteria bacterium RBG_19FT_COMBO_58_11]